MHRTTRVLLLGTLALALAGCQTSRAVAEGGMEMKREMSPAAAPSPEVGRVVKSAAEWKKVLTSEQFHVLREKGTERPFSSPLNKNKEKGTYVCAACGLALFDAEHKFDSGTGWPSFWQPVARSALGEHDDGAHGMRRTEITCARCGGHLGHVFDDGPRPTGLRYCINGVSLKHVKPTADVALPPTVSPTPKSP